MSSRILNQRIVDWRSKLLDQSCYIDHAYCSHIHRFTALDCTFCFLCKSSSTHVYYVAEQSNISYLLFPNLTHKIKTGTEKGGRLLEATHLDQSNHLANQQQVLGFAMPFASFSILCKNDGPGHHALTLFHPKFVVQ